MSRSTRSKLSPWIESLILSYGSQDGSCSSGQLKAQVIGVGQMSLSQAQGSEGPTGLLFLSDGILQIPAILTSSAWEHLQDQEERECFNSLLSHTVCIQNYMLQFHMTLEQTKSRFFLSVGELATTAAGPVKDNIPCCTTLPSVRQKICETWRALLGQEGQETQSQCGFDLTALLGEWQHDCLQSVLEDVNERLITASYAAEPQPSTSTFTSSPIHSATSSTTGWDFDRVRYKSEKCFTVPINYLLIPGGEAQLLQTPLDAANSTLSEPSAVTEDRSGDLPHVGEPAELSVVNAEWRIDDPTLVQAGCDASGNAQLDKEDSLLDEDIITKLNESDIRPLINPWDIFPPPDVTSSSATASPEATQPLLPEVILTSTQLPVQSSEETQKMSVQNSKGEQSELQPYQKPPSTACLPITGSTSASNSVSPPEQSTRLDEPCADPEKSNTFALEQESLIFEEDMVETVQRKSRGAKRKRAEALSGSPPSWLFDSKNGSGPEEGGAEQQNQTTENAKQTSTVHSDGKLFSYTYQVSGENLQDFSKFRISELLLNWAVKYLVAPKQTNNPHNTSATSDQTSSDRTEITPF